MVAWIILAIFVVITVLMILKKIPALFAIPIMAFLIAVVSGIPFKDTLLEDGTIVSGIQSLMFINGPSRLTSTIMTMFFASILGQLIKNTGIAEVTIKKVSELAGDRPTVLCILITLVMSLLFATLSGLGSVILVGNLALPILISVGVQPLTAGTLLIFSIGIGGTFNVVNWKMYQDVLGLTIPEIRSYAIILGSLMIIATLVLIFIDMRKNKVAWAAPVDIEPPAKKNNIFAIFTPIIPIILILIFNFDVNFSLTIGIIYGLLTTLNRKSMKILTKSTLDGISDVSTAVFLMMGVGMLLMVVMDPRVSTHIGGAIASVLPSSPIVYVLFFTLLAPFALYRGPMNIWGLGLGLVAIVANMSILSPGAVMAAFWTTGQVQGLDPTNTQNVWTASAIRHDVNDILKKGMPYYWSVAFIGLIIAAFIYV